MNCWNHSARVALECAAHHERDVREEKHYISVARTSNNRVISSGDLYYCLLPQCEALRTCRSGFPIATESNYGLLLSRSSLRTSAATLLFAFTIVAP